MINSQNLALAIERMPTNLSFWQAEGIFSVKIAGMMGHAANALMQNSQGEDGSPSLVRDIMMNIHKYLKPGGDLIPLTNAALQILEHAVARLGNNSMASIELGEWTRDNIVAATSGAIHGPNSPYHKKDVEDAFLLVPFESYMRASANDTSEFSAGAIGLISYPLPGITCGKSFTARRKIATAFSAYYSDNDPAAMSHYLRAATAILERYGLSDLEKAQLETAQSHAIFANTTPLAFWTLYHVLSDLTILGEVREAVLPLLTASENPNNGLTSYKIDVTEIREVSILKSVIHEALRYYASGTSLRVVVEDTMLHQYFLRKGALVFIPHRVFHFDAATWGPSVNEFDAHRFMKKTSRIGLLKGFGGGVNMCPGRFFAQNEILAMCAMISLRYDIKPAGGVWLHPGIDQSNMSLIVSPPKQNIRVDITARDCWKEGSWSFSIK